MSCSLAEIGLALILQVEISRRLRIETTGVSRINTQFMSAQQVSNLGTELGQACLPIPGRTTTAGWSLLNPGHMPALVS